MTDTDLASAIELKPCPFCGGEAVISDNNTGLVFYVRCKQCRSAGPAERCATDAAATWNTRSALSYSEDDVERVADIIADGVNWPQHACMEMARAAITALLGGRSAKTLDGASDPK